MARLTESHQVALCVLVLGEHHELEDVVDVLCEGDDVLGQTIHAQRMTSQVSKSEPLPCAVVTTLAG
jgi:hypothetical protein